MIEKLKQLLNNSRSDYFNFPVSAVIVTDKGEYYGVNVETSSPTAGICAERNALYNAITNGIKKDEIKEIHVMSKTGVYPCFICRQALVDYCNDNVEIYIYDINKIVNKVKLKDLCNYSFDKGDLK